MQEQSTLFDSDISNLVPLELEIDDKAMPLSLLLLLLLLIPLSKLISSLLLLL